MQKPQSHPEATAPCAFAAHSSQDSEQIDTKGHSDSHQGLLRCLWSPDNEETAHTLVWR